MKAVGYVRVSTAEQVSEGVSLDAQKEKIKAWCVLNGYELSSIYTDAGISGKRADNRDGLQDALKEVDKGNALIVYSLSRLARSTKDTLDIADFLSRKNADLVSITEKIDTTTAAGKMVFRMLAVLSEFERDQVSERTKAALQHKKANGEKTGGNVPFGYDVTSDGLLVINENEQKAIRLMLRLKRKGHSLRAICRELEIEGHRTKTGRFSWNHKTVGSILKRLAA